MTADQDLAGELPILFTGSNVRAILEDRKTQTRRVITRFNSFRDGIRASAARWDELDWQSSEIFVDDGPSPAGNPGPYLHVPDKDGDCSHRIYPQWRRGDRLWVRETWGVVSYAFDESGDRVKWTPDRPAKPIRDMRFGKRGYYTGHVIYAADGSFEWGDEDDSELRSAWKPSIHMPRLASRIHLEITDVRVQRVQDISEEDAIAEGCSTARFATNVPTRAGPLMSPECYRAGFACLWDSINAKRGFGWDANPWVWALTFKRMTEAAK